MKLPACVSLSLFLALMGCKTTSVQDVAMDSAATVEAPSQKSKRTENKRGVEVAIGAGNQIGSARLLATGFPHVRITNPGNLNAEVVVPAGVEPDTEIIPRR